LAIPRLVAGSALAFLVQIGEPGSARR